MSLKQASGSNTVLQFDTEDTFKVTPASPDGWVLPFISESFGLKRNLIDSKILKSTRNPSAPSRGNRDVTGDITTELDASLGRIFYHGLGTVAVTGGNPYTHTFTISALPQGMVIEKKFADLQTVTYFRYNGCKVNSLKVSVKPEGPIDFAISVVGAAETVTQTSFDTSPTTQSWNSFDGFTCTIKEGGLTLGTITEFDMTLSNNLDGSVYVLDGTGERYSLPEGQVKVEGTIKTLFTDDYLYMKALNSSETSLEMIFTKGTGDGTAGNEKLTITMEELIFKPEAPVISGPNGIFLNMGYVGYYNDGASASALKVVIKNAIASFI